MLQDFNVIQSDHLYDGVLIYCQNGRSPVFALVTNTTLEDYFKRGGTGLTRQEANLVVDRNLQAFSQIVDAKFQQGTNATHPGGSDAHPLVHVTLDDMQQSGEAFTDSVVDMSRQAHF